MNTTLKRNVLCTMVLSMGLFTSAECLAHGGHGGGHGGWHGGGHGWHGGHGGWHGGNWGGGWRGWNGGFGGSAITVGLPFGSYDYGPYCERTRYCNSVGRCWIQRTCY